MSARRCSHLALIIAVALPGALAAQGFEYAPGTLQYRLTSRTAGTQEAMGQTQEFETSTSQLVTVTLARASKDTVALTAVLDSIEIVGPMGMTPPGLDQLLGLRVAAKMSPFGATYSVEAPKDHPVPSAGQLAESLGRMLPQIKTRLAAGASWVDTTTGTISQNGLDIDRQVVASYRVVGDTAVAGEKGWKIERDANTTLTGSGVSNGQPMTMEGNSSSRATFIMSQKGVFVGGEGEDKQNIKVVLAANGMEIGVTTTENTRIEKVK